jgi:hypothetical protein
MPYFVKVGPFPSNEGWPGARGYHIGRKGKNVVVTWGGIAVRRRRHVEYVWSGRTFYKSYPCSSPAAALSKRTELVGRRIGKEGYKRLPVGQKIVSTSLSHPSVLKR